MKLAWPSRVIITMLKDRVHQHPAPMLMIANCANIFVQVHADWIMNMFIMIIYIRTRLKRATTITRPTLMPGIH